MLALTVYFMDNSKFRALLKDKYPIVLIDEYQDTNAAWVESIKSRCLGTAGSPQFGFFGDHWQKIYGNGCGSIDHASLRVIDKKANFRSVKAVVDCLNRMRPMLPQFVVDPTAQGSVRIFHTNGWTGPRQTGQHWGGDLPVGVADRAFEAVLLTLRQEGWDLAPATTKILMLTHRGLASKQGYGTIPNVFEYNDSFTRKEHAHIAFFADVLEPACQAFLSKQYGAMFAALGGKTPLISSHADKERWSAAMGHLIELRQTGTVGDLIDHLRRIRRPVLPDAVERRERELEQFILAEGQEEPAPLAELRSLRAVQYREIIALCQYLSGHSPFETNHGVKGAEFENVLVVIGRGWNRLLSFIRLKTQLDAVRFSDRPRRL